MRAYTTEDEERLRTQAFLRDWEGEGLISGEQRRGMDRDVECGLRRTNVFLRAVLFLFTLLSAGAGVGLFIVIAGRQADPVVTGTVVLFFAAIAYGGAEYAVYEWKLYRYGIEEGLAAVSVVFLCWGLQGVAFSGYKPHPGPPQSLIPATGAIASFWIYRRFGFQYFFLAAMVSVAFIPGYWTESNAAVRLIVAAVYAAGLGVVTLIRPDHRFDFLDDEYSVIEALLWAGIYFAVNLKLSTLLPDLVPQPVYWTTFALIWCLPAATIRRGLSMKDKPVILCGMVTAVVTLVTNKPYLGWERHPWDPMLLGILLTGVAIAVRRWLENSPGGVRHGFTAQRLSGRDKRLMNTISGAVGLASPHTFTPAPAAPSATFGGGSSAGGGASSDY